MPKGSETLSPTNARDRLPVLLWGTSLRTGSQSFGAHSQAIRRTSACTRGSTSPTSWRKQHCLSSTSLTTSEWEALAEYKRAFPIWGRPIEPVSTLAEVDQLLRAPTGDLDLVFESGQVNYYVRHALGLE